MEPGPGLPLPAGLRRLPRRLPPGPDRSAGRHGPTTSTPIGDRRSTTSSPARTPRLRRTPSMQILNAVRVPGRDHRRGHRTHRIRIIQYAIYGDRGVWIAKKLRALWKAGCDVSIIYSVSSRPVLSILRNPTGRGPIPMRQSVVTDYVGHHREVQPQQVDDDHRRLGHLDRPPTRPSAARPTGPTSPSATTSRCSGSPSRARRCATTRTSRRPGRSVARTSRLRPGGRLRPERRSLARARCAGHARVTSRDFGHGIYRYMPRD